jgi:hypothetical protein
MLLSSLLIRSRGPPSNNDATVCWCPQPCGDNRLHDFPQGCWNEDVTIRGFKIRISSHYARTPPSAKLDLAQLLDVLYHLQPMTVISSAFDSPDRRVGDAASGVPLDELHLESPKIWKIIYVVRSVRNHSANKVAQTG